MRDWRRDRRRGKEKRWEMGEGDWRRYKVRNKE
jgi:hypothetical protein